MTDKIWSYLLPAAQTHYLLFALAVVFVAAIIIAVYFWRRSRYLETVLAQRRPDPVDEEDTTMDAIIMFKLDPPYAMSIKGKEDQDGYTLH